MHTCIYCLELKPSSQFNKEHVLQDAYGQYLNALTLINKICKNCNDTFGNGIDRELARNSIEGERRFTQNIKCEKEFNPRKHAKGVKFKIKEGILNGLMVQRVNNRSVISLNTEVALRNHEGNYDFFPIENIPDKQTAELKYPPHEDRLIILLSSSEQSVINDIKNKWETKNINYKVYQNSKDELKVENSSEITLDVQRALAKSVFNLPSFS
jgi:hypothetical protein